MKNVLLAILAIAVAVVLVAPSSDAVNLPKLDRPESMVDTIQAKRDMRRKQSKKSKQDQCMAQCLQVCWLNCDEGCRCVCFGVPKGEFCLGPI